MPADHDILSKVYAAFNTRDIDAVLALMHADVDWPNGWEGGRVHGREAVREYWTRQWRAIDPHVEPIAFDRDAAGRVVVTVQQTVRDPQGNVIKHGIVEHVYLIVDGLIKTMDIAD